MVQYLPLTARLIKPARSFSEVFNLPTSGVSVGNVKIGFIAEKKAGLTLRGRIACFLIMHSLHTNSDTVATMAQQFDL
ncbi:MAG: hypothetical protein BA862_05680 [Desulfobulbaceae bacterium S3730MH12]|nr:MAG: hypothetical protein BA862_05680 [Desulfobulbaceae bacterium S3730MH12]